jgi:hypothetical protein
MKIESQLLEVDKSANRDLISGDVILPRSIRGKSYILNRKRSGLSNSLNRRKSSTVTPLYSQSGGGVNKPEVKLITPAAENVESAHSTLKRQKKKPYLLEPGDDIIMSPHRKIYKRRKQIGKGKRQVGKGRSSRQIGKGRKKQIGKGKKQIGRGHKSKKRKIAKKKKLFDQFSF